MYLKKKNPSLLWSCGIVKLLRFSSDTFKVVELMHQSKAFHSVSGLVVTRGLVAFDVAAVISSGNLTWRKIKQPPPPSQPSSMSIRLSDDEVNFLLLDIYTASACCLFQMERDDVRGAQHVQTLGHRERGQHSGFPSAGESRIVAGARWFPEIRPTRCIAKSREMASENLLRLSV